MKICLVSDQIRKTIWIRILKEVNHNVWNRILTKIYFQFDETIIGEIKKLVDKEVSNR